MHCEMCDGVHTANRKREVKPLVDGTTRLFDLDRAAYDELEFVLREGEESDIPAPWGRPRWLTTTNRRRKLLEQLPTLVPIQRCDCGASVCLSYVFRLPDEGTRGRLLQFELPDVALVWLDDQERIAEFECITDMCGLSCSPAADGS